MRLGFGGCTSAAPSYGSAHTNCTPVAHTNCPLSYVPSHISYLQSATQLRATEFVTFSCINTLTCKRSLPASFTIKFPMSSVTKPAGSKNCPSFFPSVPKVRTLLLDNVISCNNSNTTIESKFEYRSKLIYLGRIRLLIKKTFLFFIQIQ